MEEMKELFVWLNWVERRMNELEHHRCMFLLCLCICYVFSLLEKMERMRMNESVYVIFGNVKMAREQKALTNSL